MQAAILTGTCLLAYIDPVMRVHIIQHAAFEGPGCISHWCANHQWQVSMTRLYDGGTLPDIDTIEMLIILGGPMGVADRQTYPWLEVEQAFIRDCINNDKIVLGICLGAQLIAHCLGATISTSPEKEIGWFEVRRHPAITGHPLARIFSENLNALHWHGETFSLPDGAKPLASSTACINQGFVYKNRIIALQFHLETSVESAQLLIDHCRDELTDAPFIQTEAEILSSPERFLQAQQKMSAVLDYLSAQPVN